MSVSDFLRGANPDLADKIDRQKMERRQSALIAFRHLIAGEVRGAMMRLTSEWNEDLQGMAERTATIIQMKIMECCSPEHYAFMANQELPFRCANALCGKDALHNSVRKTLP